VVPAGGTGYGYYIAAGTSRVGLGDVAARHALYYATTPPNNVDGVAWSIETAAGLRSLSISDGSGVNVDSLTGGAGATAPVMIYTQFANFTTNFIVKDFYQHVRGTKGAGTFTMNMWSFSGPAVYDFDNVRDDVSITSIATGNINGMVLTGTAYGKINNYNITVGVDTAPTGIYVLGKSSLTIPHNFTISNSNFLGIPSGGSDIYYGTSGGSNQRNVRLLNNVLKDGTFFGNLGYQTFIYSTSNTVNDATQTFLALSGGASGGGETSQQTRMDRAGTFQRLRVVITANTLNTGFANFTLIKGGSLQTVKVSIPYGATGTFTDDSHTSVAAVGDLYSIEVDTGGGSGNVQFRLVQVEFTY
jgi:hypothetical protein